MSEEGAHRSRRVRAIVSGRVQGVWYRAHTQERAVALGLTGFVRNRPDGTVEIVAVGAEDSVNALLDWARVGPSLAEVTDVHVSTLAEEDTFDSFEVRY